MKIAYLILTHDNPAHLRRLIDRLSFKENRFFIHVDKKAACNGFSHISGAHVHFLKDRVNCSWGDYSLVQATLNLMKAARDSGQKFDYLVLLSGACYPVKSNGYIDRFFGANNGREFIEVFSFPNIEFDKLSIRLDKFWFRATHPFRQYKLRLQNFLLKHVPERDYRKQMGGLEPFTGSQWWALTQACADFALEYAKNNPDYIRLYKSSSCPDESFFQTIVMNSRFRENVAHKITYTEWKDKSWSPSLIGPGHLDHFGNAIVLDSASNNCPNEKKEVLFARKFDRTSAEILNSIDLLTSASAG